MKILSAPQIRQLDQDTITNEPIASIDLMERASRTFTRAFLERYTQQDREILIFAGPGNNGGDALAIARLLHEAAHSVRVYLCRIGSSQSEDCRVNEERLRQKRVIPIQEIQQDDPLPEFPASGLIIDGLFGSGLSRPVSGYWASLLERINELPAERIAIDIPSGLFADQPSRGTIIRADHTISFQVPKLAFFMAENAPFTGSWQVVDIGLDAKALAAIETPFLHLGTEEVCRLLHTRGRFDHKGTYGHALIVAGSYGKIGAAILSARAALRSGCGLVTTHLPRCGYEIMQIAFPEAMVQTDKHRFVCSNIPVTGNYAAIGAGPGLGTDPLTKQALTALLENEGQSLVLDADALNILAQHQDLLKQIPRGSILTPHPKEFERLFGPSANNFEQLELLRERAQGLQCYIILKGGHTAIASPEGTIHFNTSGNPGMGTAGAGDVLTGILTGLLAQGYTAQEACLLGVHLHGLAGDLAAEDLQQESLIAEDIIRYLGAAFRFIRGFGKE